MSDVRKRKGNVSKEKDVAKKIGSGRKESESSIKVILRYAVIVAVVAVCYHLSPYKLQLVPKDGMPIFSSSSSTPGNLLSICSYIHYSPIRCGRGKKTC